ncbi:MAG: hypothetical protein K1X74_16300 [Pirellulales bacterium]|nr:hypothetical protein [Pirellulales bacterium]
MKRVVLRGVFTAVVGLVAASGAWAPAQDAALTAKLQQGFKALREGKIAEAETISLELVANTNLPDAHLLRAAVLEQKQAFRQAASEYSQLLKIRPRAVELYRKRGEMYFYLSMFEEAQQDFDRIIAIDESQSKDAWQRGITLYYLGNFPEAMLQFEETGKASPNDVENALWHFLCTAKVFGIEEARKRMLPLGKDHRIPMKEIYAFYKGDVQQQAILMAVQADAPPVPELNERLLYAHLYVALFHDLNGRKELARNFLAAYVDNIKAPAQFMWEVARVHYERLKVELANQQPDAGGNSTRAK